jgi:hypothetical protein
LLKQKEEKDTKIGQGQVLPLQSLVFGKHETKSHVNDFKRTQTFEDKAQKVSRPNKRVESDVNRRKKSELPKVSQFDENSKSLSVSKNKETPLRKN